MATVQQKLEILIRDRLADGEADLETQENGQVVGSVISSAFEDKSFDERRAILRALFVKHLTSQDIDAINFLLTYTPEEWSVPLQEF